MSAWQTILGWFGTLQTIYFRCVDLLSVEYHLIKHLTPYKYTNSVKHIIYDFCCQAAA